MPPPVSPTVNLLKAASTVSLLTLASRVTGLVRDHDKTLAAMANVRCPTLLIWGARDQLLPPPAADTLAGYLRNTQVSKIFLPDVGHYPPLEVPARFAQLTLDFLQVVAPPDALR